MYLDPTRSAGDGRATVLRAPPLHEADPNGAHLRELVDRFVALAHGTQQKVGKLLVVEDFHVAPRRDLADCRRVPTVPHVTVLALHEDALVARTLSEYFPSDVGELDPLPYVPAGLLYDWVAMDV